MQRERKLLFAKISVILGVIPVLIWAHDYGPDPGKNGVPGESNCTEVSCHVGTALNGGPGSVSIAFPGDQTYTPGVKQHLKVTIADSSERKAGFQLTARVTGSNKTQAGAFASTDGFTLVLCSDTNLVTIQELDFPNPQTCPANKPLTYIEHNLTGASRIVAGGSETYELDWTPPATNAGNITLFVEGNGANGDGSERGDHIYSKTYNLAPATSGGGGPTPAIAQNGVKSGASFVSGIVPNSWVTIQGTNLANTTDTWDKAISNGQLPTTLDGVGVTIGGKPAYVNFISPGQINVLAPDVGSGSMDVTVTSGGNTSAPLSTTSQTVGPAFFLWVGKYAVATRQDFSWAVANSTFPGVTTVAAKPGDVIILWGTGFGPTSPAFPVGVQVPPNTYSTASPVTVTVGGTNATVFGAALAPGFAGLYQVAIQIPASAADGDLPVIATINGAQSPTGVFITVKH